MSQTRVTAQYYVPTPPSPVPRAASKFLFNAHPAKHAAIKYKMKLITNSGVAKPLPIPKAIAAARWKQCGSLNLLAQLIFQRPLDGFRCDLRGSECAPDLIPIQTCPNYSLHQVRDLEWHASDRLPCRSSPGVETLWIVHHQYVAVPLSQCGCLNLDNEPFRTVRHLTACPPAL